MPRMRRMAWTRGRHEAILYCNRLPWQDSTYVTLTEQVKALFLDASFSPASSKGFTRTVGNISKGISEGISEGATKA